MKHCNKCDTTRPLSDFHKKKDRKDGHSSTCKYCVNNRVREYDPEYNRNVKLLRAYGITTAEYEALLKSQNGVCAICKRNVPHKGDSMCVDHDHSTGAVRGILCSNCNRAIGLLEDNVAFLQSAINYLGG